MGSPAFGGAGPYLRDNTKSPFEASHPPIIQRIGHHTASVDANHQENGLTFVREYDSIRKGKQKRSIGAIVE